MNLKSAKRIEQIFWRRKKLRGGMFGGGSFESNLSNLIIILPLCVKSLFAVVGADDLDGES